MNDPSLVNHTTTLDSLRVLTQQLPSFPPAIAERASFKEHKMECGTSFSWDILNREELSCAHWFNSQGCIFPKHTHTGREWLIIFKGSLILIIDDVEERLLVGQSKIIEPYTEHSAKFVEDCHYLAIVIPKTHDWPTNKE